MSAHALNEVWANISYFQKAVIPVAGNHSAARRARSNSRLVAHRKLRVVSVKLQKILGHGFRSTLIPSRGEIDAVPDGQRAFLDAHVSVIGASFCS
jgi:hypothetical protein